MRSAGVKPDVISFNAAIAACARAGEWKPALSLLGQMRAAGAPPNVISFNAAITACERGRRSEEALTLLADMPAAGAPPDVISFSAAISACAKGGQWKKALSLLDAMRLANVPPNAISFNAAITACEKGGCGQRALALLAEMAEAGFVPDDVSFTSAMQALVASHELDAAFEFLRRVQQTTHAPGSYALHHVLLTACRRIGDARAATLQSTMHQLGLSSVAAVVTFVQDGEELQVTNGWDSNTDPERQQEAPHHLNAALEALFRDVCEQTDYRPRYEALPLDFVHKASKEQQIRSLKYHAEKKALACMVLHGTAEELSMRVNFKCCADCHAFLAAAAKHLGRPIQVLEPSKRHTFDTSGGCSCAREGIAAPSLPSSTSVAPPLRAAYAQGSLAPAAISLATTTAPLPAATSPAATLPPGPETLVPKPALPAVDKPLDTAAEPESALRVKKPRTTRTITLADAAPNSSESNATPTADLPRAQGCELDADASNRNNPALARRRQARKVRKVRAREEAKQALDSAAAMRAADGIECADNAEHCKQSPSSLPRFAAFAVLMGVAAAAILMIQRKKTQGGLGAFGLRVRYSIRSTT